MMSLSVPNRLAVLHHSHDSLLRFRMHEQAHEGFTFEREDPSFVDQGSGLDVASAHDLGDRLAEVEVVLADEAPVAHVDELRHDRRGTAATSDRKAFDL